MLPHLVVYSVTKDGDLPSQENLIKDSAVVIGESGSSKQRNAGLDFIGDGADLIAFFDDDYMPSRSCFEMIIKFFDNFPDVAGVNGEILADGAIQAEISCHEAKLLLEEYRTPKHTFSILKDLKGLYGCNMVFRATAIDGARFDEGLPLYGWQEDVDFAHQVSRNGRLVKTDAFAGVHLGVKSGRTSGLKFGYSQIANPLYLYKKGSMSGTEAIALALKNLVSNHMRLLRPEPWVDRRGRVKGNWRAIADLARRRISPGNILKM